MLHKVCTSTIKVSKFADSVKLIPQTLCYNKLHMTADMNFNVLMQMNKNKKLPAYLQKADLYCRMQVYQETQSLAVNTGYQTP